MNCTDPFYPCNKTCWFQAYARIGMVKEATEAAAQAKDSELLGRLKSTFGQNTAAGALFDTLRDRLSLT